MNAQILDGTACAAKIKADIKKIIEERLEKGLSRPELDVILVGNNPASSSYVKYKHQACEEVGILSRVHHELDTIHEDQLIKIIESCNNDPNVHGILLQLPLPNHINTDNVLEKIRPEKDVDGFHPYNLGRLTQRRPLLRPCTPFGVMTLLRSTKESLEGKYAVVVGASNIVGRPMALELLMEKCTVTICHRFTKNLSEFVKMADILISATGSLGVIKSEWIKPGATVIDVGFHRLSHDKIMGDIDFETAKERAHWITPVPGGVGPMTVATLLQNTVLAAELQDVYS